MACPVCGKPSPCTHEQQRTSVLVGPEVYEPLKRPDGQLWREEVVSRVQQHRARRRKHSDPNGTMELNFQGEMRTSAPFSETDVHRGIARSEPKIIEFPRPLTTPFFSPGRGLEPEDLEPAGPVLDGPRILDAPEPTA